MPMITKTSAGLLFFIIAFRTPAFRKVHRLKAADLDADTSLPSPDSGLEDVQADLKALFEALDKDSSGKVSSKEWGQAVTKDQETMRKYFGGASLEAIGQAFNRIDINGDKELTWEEFMAAAATGAQNAGQSSLAETSESSKTKWESGDRVVIQGLVNAHQYNGQPGTLLAKQETGEHGREGQWQVKLDKDAEVLGVLSDNLVAGAAFTTESSKKTSGWAWSGNDNIQIDPVNEEVKLRAASNVLLDPSQEHVIMAFKVGRDKTYFTSKRILFRPKGWLWDGSVKYQSIPYQSIVSFSVKTAGRWPDVSTELNLFTEIEGLHYVTIGFRKGSREEKADIFAILKFMNSKILGPDAGAAASLVEVKPTAVFPIGDYSWQRAVTDLLGNIAEQIDASEAERVFKESFPILQQDETVDMAFKEWGQDSTLLTSKRIIKIDVKGIFGDDIGKGVLGYNGAIEYQSIPWRSVRAFSIKSPGMWEVDSQLTIWTPLQFKPGERYDTMEMHGEIKQHLRKGRADITALQMLFSKRILSTKARPRLLPKSVVQPKRPSGYLNSAVDILHWLGGDQALQDAGVAEAHLRATVGILQDNEHVELAFKGGNRLTARILPPGMTYLTTHRIISVKVSLPDYSTEEELMAGAILTSDYQVTYMSLPYETISAFAVRTAGMLDLDCEFILWTEIPQAEEDGDRDGGMAKLEFDLKQGSDLFAIQKFLYAKVLGDAGTGGASALIEQESSSQPPNFADVMHWMGNNGKEMTTQKATSTLRDSVPILQPGETVLKAFKTGRDVTVLTSTRALIMDVQFNNAVEYRSVPYASIGAFSVESAGTLDSDAQFRLYTKMHWWKEIKQDLRYDTSNLQEIQALFCSKMLGSGPASLLQLENKEPHTTAFDWIQGNAHKITPEQAEAKLQTEPAILQNGEKVKLAYKVGKDMTVYTTHRILELRVSLTKAIKYKSIPYRSVSGFSVSTAANFFDGDEEVVVNTGMPKLPSLKQDIKKGDDDIFDVQVLLSEKMLTKS